jgi:O-antigen/teichoic acid export membrane protein
MVRGLVEYKSEGVVILLAVLFGLFGLCGIGHFYVGRIVRGLVIFFVYGLLFILSLLLLIPDLLLGGGWTVLSLVVSLWCLAFWIWQIFDARKVCREHNRQARGD